MIWLRESTSLMMSVYPVTFVIGVDSISVV